MKRPFEDVSKDDVANHIIAESNDYLVPPYDVSKEECPLFSSNSQNYIELIEGTNSIVKMLENSPFDSERRDPAVEGILAEFKQRRTSNFPSAVRIALVGNTKSGKSSVINSILNLGMVARQGDAGDSCTWVVQEFGYRFPGQVKPFAAKVFFFPQDKRREIISTLVREYFQACYNKEQAVVEQKKNEQVLEDFAIKRTAMTVFHALFCGRHEFATQSAAEEFLSSAKCEYTENIIDTLCGWAEKLVLNCLRLHDYVYFEAITTQTLMRHLSPYMTTVEWQDDGPSPSLWPFVSQIKFGLDVSLLKHNITLIDIPELVSPNKTYKDNAAMQIQTCTHYMVVAEIGRADNESFIREGLKRAHTTGGHGRTILVLTHADTIDDNIDVKGIPKDLERLQTLNIEIAELRQKRADVASQIKRVRGLERYELMEKRDKLTEETRTRLVQHCAHRIHMRSRMVSSRMQDLYSKLTSDPFALPVFCVGNAAYRKHQAGYAVYDPQQPILTVEGTNIPALRKHLLAPVQAKAIETKEMVATQLPMLLLCFSQWLSKTHSDRKSRVEAILSELPTLASHAISQNFRALRQKMEEGILNKIRNEESGWSHEAQILLQSWARDYNAQQHLTLLEELGHKKGKGRGAPDISWTGELIALRSKMLRRFFDDILKQLSLFSTDITRELHRRIETTIFKIESDTQIQLTVVEPYVDHLYQVKDNITTLVQKSIKVLRKDLGQILQDVSSDNPKNPIVIAMRPVYARARVIKGKLGSPKDRLSAFETDVIRSGSGVWMKSHNLIKKQLTDPLRKHEQVLIVASISFFEGLRDEFQRMCSSGKMDDSEAVELRDNVQKMLFQLAAEKRAM